MTHRAAGSKWSQLPPKSSASLMPKRLLNRLIRRQGTNSCGNSASFALCLFMSRALWQSASTSAAVPATTGKELGRPGTRCRCLCFYQCRTVVDEDTDSYAQVLGCLGGAVRGIDVFPKPMRDAVRRAVLTEYGEDVDTWGDLLKGFAERAKTTE